MTNLVVNSEYACASNADGIIGRFSDSSSENDFARQFLRDLFEEAIQFAKPSSFMGEFINKHFPENPKGNIIVVGAGKAAASMAAAFEIAAVERGWADKISGVVVTRYGYEVPTSKIKVLKANHPVPDQASVIAGETILSELKTVGPDDLVISLVSGGGSALLCAPASGVSLADKQQLNKVLLNSGAPIHAMNCIRKHVSKIKGGRLARSAMPARVVSLLMSDIPGDDVSSIASGPTVSDETTLEMARNFVAKYKMDLPASIMEALNDPRNETPKKDDRCFKNAQNHLVMTPGMVLQKVMETIKKAGFEILYLGDDLEGEASELGKAHAELALEAARSHRKVCILSGGETTVTMKGKGRGGRNTEYLLSVALHLNGEPGIYALAGDTDGVDGSEDNAGAIIDPTTIKRAQNAGLNLNLHLDRNDSYSAFEALNDLVVTGPTMTNVNDFRAILVFAHDV